MTFSIEAIETLSLLWRATWQSTVLALLVAVVILASRRWLAAKWRVVLWTLPLFRMLFVVVPASGLSIFNGISYLTEPRVASPILSLRENDLSLFAEMNAELPVVELDGQSVRETSLQSQAFNVPTTAASIATENNSCEQAANRLQHCDNHHITMAARLFGDGTSVGMVGVGFATNAREMRAS